MKDTLTGEKTIALSIAQEIMTTSVDIPSIPDNVRKIFEITRQPETDIDIPVFAKLVESDPGLFTRLMQLANSPFYSEVEEIVSLRAAITRIGLQETVNSVCLYFFQRLLPKFPDIQGFSYADFWTFSWVCAVANRRLGHPNLSMDVLPGDLYMAGMLCGMGKLLMAIHFPGDFAQCVETAQRLECPLYEVEKDVFGTTDGLVASRVLRNWNLPSVICEAVAFHQVPEQAEPMYRLIAGLTQFAYGIAGLSGIGASGDGCKIELSETFLGQKEGLVLSRPEVQASLQKEIYNSLESKMASMGADGKGAKASPRGYGSRGRQGAVDSHGKRAGILGWIKGLFSD